MTGLPQYVVGPAGTPVLIAALLLGVFGLIVLIREQASRVSRTLALFTLGGVIWLVGYAGVYDAPSKPVALFWARIGYWGVPSIPAALYLFTIRAVGISGRRRFVLRMVFSTAAVFTLIAVSTDLLLANIHQYRWESSYPCDKDYPQ